MASRFTVNCFFHDRYEERHGQETRARLHARWSNPPNAARLALHVLLRELLRDERVSRQSWLRRAFGQLPQRHRLWPRVPGSSWPRGRGASEYKDIVAAGKYLQGRSDVDPSRVGLWGGSYGGYLTALGLARNSDIFAAGVDFHGVHDWPTDNWDGKNISPELTKLAHESSPVTSVDTWKSPVLFIHGDDDRNVYFTQTVDLVARLRARGVAIEQLIFPDEVHDFLLHRSWLAGYRATSDFFDRHLKQHSDASRTTAKTQ